MSSEEADQTADTSAPEEQKDTEVEEDKIEKVEVTESSEIVDEVTQQEESEGQTEEQSDGQEAEATEAESVDEAESTGSRKLTIDDIRTAPVDFRFPTTNQARHCYTRYIEYHRCVQVKGENDPDCNKYARYYRSLCPGEWIDKWNEERENGTFPGPL